jgi:hypothetical protein
VAATDLFLARYLIPELRPLVAILDPGMSRIGATLLLQLLISALAAGQSSGTALGLRYVGSLGAYAGAVTVQRGAPGGEAGAFIDLGNVRSPRLRLVGDASFLFASLSEFVPQDDRTYSGEIFDLSGTVSLLAIGGSPGARCAPYGSLGVGVHALSSSYGSLVLDQRYNANRFGLSGAAGLRWWTGRDGRNGVTLEVRRTYALNVNRWSLRAGAVLNFGSLARPAR